MIVPPLSVACAAVFCLFGGLAVQSAGSGVQPVRAAQFASGVSLVEVYVTVTGSDGQPLTGLNVSDFTVTEDGEPQRLGTFAAGELPLAVAIGLDRSFSVAKRQLATAVAAARVFVDGLRPADQVMLLAIGSETEILAPLSSDHATALAALGRVEPWGSTPLYDATLAAIEAIQPAAGRRALILLSDGSDRYSRATATEVVEQARRSDVLIYPIAIGPARPPVFAELAAVTGGRSFQTTNPAVLETTMTTIARELRFQYLLGYTPERPVDERPRWRSIHVAVNRPQARVRARDGYLSR